MKKMIVSLVLMASAGAWAHPGKHTLTCKSAKSSGGKQKIEISLMRPNAKGMYPPKISVSVDGKKYTLDTSDEMELYGDTFHNSPLGVIRVTAENYNENTAVIFGSFSVVAIPNTVRAFDEQGNAVKWRFEDEKDPCGDANGKARFQGILNGGINIQSDKNAIPFDTEILDCELSYNSGMAC